MTPTFPVSEFPDAESPVVVGEDIGDTDVIEDVDNDDDEYDDDEDDLDTFLEQCMELIPESYVGDEADKTIILRFLEDMSKFAHTLARLMSDYR